MQSEKGLSIIFVAGAWHNEYHIRPIIPHLESHGYRVVPVTLKTSLRSGANAPTVPDNIDHIYDIIKSEIDAGYDICVVGHSVSGQSCAGALSKYLTTASTAQKASIKHVIFIACFFNAVRACEGLTWYTIDFDTMWADLADPMVFYNDMPAEAAKPFVDALIDNRAQFPPEITDLWRSIPGTYLLCMKDLAIPPQRQVPEAEENGMKLIELDMDHCPYVSRPAELANVMHDVLGSL
jgi:hypothetical protein